MQRNLKSFAYAQVMLNWPSGPIISTVCVHVCAHVCNSLASDRSDDLEGNPNRQGRHLLHKRGVTPQTPPPEHQNTSSQTLLKTHAHAHTVWKLHLPWLLKCLPGFSVHLWWQNDQSAPNNPNRTLLKCTHTGAGEAPQKSVASLLKSSMGLVCLIETIPDSKTNKPYCTQSFISAPLPSCTIFVGTQVTVLTWQLLIWCIRAWALCKDACGCRNLMLVFSNPNKASSRV